MAPFY